MHWGGGYGGYFSGVGGSLLEQQILNQMKKLILAVMCTIKEIAIKPEKKSCVQILFKACKFFPGLIAISLIAYMTARIIFFI